MSIESLHEAIKLAGGQTALAEALKTVNPRMSQGHVQKWLRSQNPEKMPPAEYCPTIERLTGVRCERLRPDVDWAVIRGECKGDELEAEVRARSCGDRRDVDRRAPEAALGEFGEPRAADRRQEDRRRSDCENEASA